MAEVLDIAREAAAQARPYRGVCHHGHTLFTSTTKDEHAICALFPCAYCFQAGLPDAQPCVSIVEDAATVHLIAAFTEIDRLLGVVQEKTRTIQSYDAVMNAAPADIRVPLITAGPLAYNGASKEELSAYLAEKFEQRGVSIPAPCTGTCRNTMNPDQLALADQLTELPGFRWDSGMVDNEGARVFARTLSTDPDYILGVHDAFALELNRSIAMIGDSTVVPAGYRNVCVDLNDPAVGGVLLCWLASMGVLIEVSPLAGVVPGGFGVRTQPPVGSPSCYRGSTLAEACAKALVALGRCA